MLGWRRGGSCEGFQLAYLFPSSTRLEAGRMGWDGRRKFGREDLWAPLGQRGKGDCSGFPSTKQGMRLKVVGSQEQ